MCLLLPHQKYKRVVQLGQICICNIRCQQSCPANCLSTHLELLMIHWKSDTCQPSSRSAVGAVPPVLVSVFVAKLTSAFRRKMKQQKEK